MLFKFQDDSTVNKFGIVVLLKHVWMYAKKKDLGRGKRENEFGKKREYKNIS